MSEKPVVSILGTFQYGKSTLMNCVLGATFADMNIKDDGAPTTHYVWEYCYGEIEETHIYIDGNIKPVERIGLDNPQNYKRTKKVVLLLPNENLKRIIIRDTPGLNARASEEYNDTELTEKAIETTKFAIVVVSHQAFDGAQNKLIGMLQGQGIPFVVIANCRNDTYPRHWNPKDFDSAPFKDLKRHSMLQRINSDETVYPCNLLWYWLGLMKKNPGGERYANYKIFIENYNVEIADHFGEFYGIDTPTPDDLIENSNVQPLIDFITGASGTKARNLPTLLAIHEAYNEYRSSVIKKIDEAKKIITG